MKKGMANDVYSKDRFTFATILISLILTVQIAGEQYQLPAIWSQTQQNLRLYQIRELNYPSIELNRVYKRQIYKVNQPYTDNAQHSNATLIDQFDVCWQSPPEISFKNIGYYGLQQPSNIYSADSQVVTSNITNGINDTNQKQQQQAISKKSASIIYDYDVLKSKYQNIIDMVHHQGSIFTISSTANFSVYSLTDDDNGIQLRTTLKGIDWDELYKYRYQSWLRKEDSEKKRQDLIDQVKETSRNKSVVDDKVNSTQNDAISNSSIITNNSSSQQQSNQTTPRRLQQSVSPKVLASQSPTKQNTTVEQQIYYTGPPPPFPKAHLQKGYFQFMDYNKLLIFANNQYLIAYDIQKNWCFLLSQQLNYDYLFTKKSNEETKTNETKQPDDDPANNKVNKTISSDDTNKVNQTQSTEQKQSLKNATQQQQQSQQQQIPKPKTISIPDPQPVILPQFTQMSQFQQIAKINETHFSVIDKRKGVFIYRISQQKPQKFQSYSNNPSNYFLKKTAFLGKDQFGKLFDDNQQLNLVDLLFYQNKSLLLVLDYSKGVFAFEQKLPLLSNENNKNTNENNKNTNENNKNTNENNKNTNENNKNTNKNNTNTNSRNNNPVIPFLPQPDFTLSSYRIIKKMCTLMQFSQISQQLYLSCNKIYRISLKNWPKIIQKTYPHPLINIRQIYIQEQMDIMIMSGYSVFKVMYLDRTANYFQDDMLDKIVFYRDCVITANEKHIIALKYKIDKPTINCQTQNKSLLGMHNILLRTTADCNPDYIQSINYNLTPNKTIHKDDLCVYNVYKTLYIWEQGEVPLKPLAIVILIFLIFISVMIIWYVLIKFRMRRAQLHLRYLSQQDQQGHKTLNEEEDPNKQLIQQKITQNSQSGPDPANKSSPVDIRTEQQEHNKDLYTIE